MRSLARILLLGIVLQAAPSRAWWPEGHSIVAEAAVRSLPADVPAFFREGGVTVAHLAQDPDVFKNRSVSELNRAEQPEHYIDWEFLKGSALPPDRLGYLSLLARLQVDPLAAGTLPYSVTEWTSRLQLAFAEHRRWPKLEPIRAKCLVYAGILSHYSGDLCMPLHTTIHHDGRARADGTSPRSGIHARVDSLIERLELRPGALARAVRPESYESVFPAVLREIERSRALIDRTYELEPSLPTANPPAGWRPSKEVRDFAEERAGAAVRFTASLYLTAWRLSEKTTFPDWHRRQRETDRTR